MAQLKKLTGVQAIRKLAKPVKQKKNKIKKKK